MTNQAEVDQREEEEARRHRDGPMVEFRLTCMASLWRKHLAFVEVNIIWYYNFFIVLDICFSIIN